MKKAKKPTHGAGLSHTAVGAAAASRPPEDEVFYAPLQPSGGGGGGGGRAKLQSLVEDLLPTASLFNSKLANQHITLDNPLKKASAEVRAERITQRRAERARRKMMSAKERKQKRWFLLDAAAGLKCVIFRTSFGFTASALHSHTRFHKYPRSHSRAPGSPHLRRCTTCGGSTWRTRSPRIWRGIARPTNRA